MYGISGMVRLDDGKTDHHQLSSMIATPHHRGPDASGVHVPNAVGMAHAWLSIIDLQSGGQPMSSADGRLRITFKDEISTTLT
jgi:asparagine synthase (glutamine-hydrolysing)